MSYCNAIPVIQPLTRDVACQCDAPSLKSVSIQMETQKLKRRSKGKVIGYFLAMCIFIVLAGNSLLVLFHGFDCHMCVLKISAVQVKPVGHSVGTGIKPSCLQNQLKGHPWKTLHSMRAQHAPQNNVQMSPMSLISSQSTQKNFLAS